MNFWNLVFGFIIQFVVQRVFSERLIKEDLLIPYSHKHGSHRTHRQIRSCQHRKYRNLTHETFPSSVKLKDVVSMVESNRFVKNIAKYSWDTNYVYGHHFVVENPAQTVSVLEPGDTGGCKKHWRSTVKNSTRNHQCLLAINAGFFDVTTGECLGNLVSNGTERHNSNGIQNAHFGIKKDGSLFFGYISEDDILADNFNELVGGVLWLVRNGENYLNASTHAECPDAQTTGTFTRFVEVQSGRVAIGHDKHGRLIILVVNGKTDQRGVNLYEMADMLIQFGAINAINLDGGGSVSLLLNNTLVNFPSDECSKNGFIYGCSRRVSSAVCVHSPYCDPHDCSGHGVCVSGTCKCTGNWSGDKCDKLMCSYNCSSNGRCKADGCDCFPGWQGDLCQHSCPRGFYGKRCLSRCHCKHGGTCDVITGNCRCPPGYIGDFCEKECPFGFYGLNCNKLCFCDSCGCDHVTGSCEVKNFKPSFWASNQCFLEKAKEKSLLAFPKTDQFSLWYYSFIVISSMCAISIILNISMVCMMFTSFYPLNRWRKVSKSSSFRYQQFNANEHFSSLDETDHSSIECK